MTSKKRPREKDEDPEVSPEENPTALNMDSVDYSVAWICALSLELEASRAMLDEEHPPLPLQPGDDNVYVLGRIGQHNVVMACLPAGNYGTNSAAIVATNLHRSFIGVRATLMVGIGGGVPGRAEDQHLGDIVVAARVMQYDMGKNIGDGKFERTADRMEPSRRLSAAVAVARSDPELQVRIKDLLRTRFPRHRPSQPDQLFQASYEHVPNNKPNCDKCDPKMLEIRRPRTAGESPKIYYGGIGSGNTLMRNAKDRDDIANQFDLFCFEMEAAGIMDKYCLPIRGICDYSDSHKNKAWQRYAARAAAAYARELLRVLQLAPRLTHWDKALAGMASEHVTVDEEHSKRRKELLESLGFPQLDARMTNVQRAHSQTCRWLLSHSKYRDWLNPQKQWQTNGFLWIVGKAGVGKSTIMKFAYMETKAQLKVTDTSVASFFFNARGDVLERSITGMYRSLLLQLLKAYPDLQAILDNHDIFPQNQKTCPGLNVLKEALEGAAMALKDRPFTCFVDALDECDEQEVRDMTQFFTELAEKTTLYGIQFRVCFSSRPYPYIDIHPEVLLILEKEDGHAEDLSQYVASRLKIKDPSLLADVRDRILEKAAGIFMWVVLVVDILNKEQDEGALALRQKLENLPVKLSELFRRILKRDSHQVDRLLLCVLWLLCTKRPMNPLEFRHALWAGLLESSNVDPELPGTDSDEAFKLVTSSSKGLAEVTKSEKPTVQFIHESVRDFLVKDNGLRDLWPDLGFEWEALAHDKLRHCCDTYLSHPDVQPTLERLEAERDQEKDNALAKKYPFLEYAVQQLLHHADAAAVVIPQDEFASRFFSAGGARLLGLFSRTRTGTYTLSENKKPVHILARQGLEHLLRAQMRRAPATFINSEEYQRAFFEAISGRHSGAVAALLGLPSVIRNGVDITQGVRARAVPRTTPMTWAAEVGNLGLVEALIQRGADVNPANGYDLVQETPMSRAFYNGHEDVAWFLFHRGALDERHTRNRRSGQTMLMSAARDDRRAEAKRLVNRGADVNAKDHSGKTSLIIAIEAGHEILAQYLVRRGASVNDRNGDGKTSLMLAVEAGHENLAQLLVQRGANVNDRNGDGKTSLMIAVEAGHENMAQFLVQRGANVNDQDEDGMTALMFAAKAGHEILSQDLRAQRDSQVGDNIAVTPEVLTVVTDHRAKDMAEALLQSGAQVDDQDRSGRTALMIASVAGNKAMARLLIGEGAHVNVQNRAGETALMLAVGTGHRAEVMVRFLISVSADVGVQDATGRTALMLASQLGGDRVALCLVDNGADVNVEDNAGRTALIFALETVISGDTKEAKKARKAHFDIARHLIAKGAGTRSSENQRALSLALARGYPSIAWDLRKLADNDHAE